MTQLIRREGEGATDWRVITTRRRRTVARRIRNADREAVFIAYRYGYDSGTPGLADAAGRLTKAHRRQRRSNVYRLSAYGLRDEQPQRGVIFPVKQSGFDQPGINRAPPVVENVLVCRAGILEVVGSIAVNVVILYRWSIRTVLAQNDADGIIGNRVIGEGEALKECLHPRAILRHRAVRDGAPASVQRHLIPGEDAVVDTDTLGCIQPVLIIPKDRVADDFICARDGRDVVLKKATFDLDVPSGIATKCGVILAEGAVGDRYRPTSPTALNRQSTRRILNGREREGCFAALQRRQRHALPTTLDRRGDIRRKRDRFGCRTEREQIPPHSQPGVGTEIDFHPWLNRQGGIGEYDDGTGDKVGALTCAPRRRRVDTAADAGATGKRGRVRINGPIFNIARNILSAHPEGIGCSGNAVVGGAGSQGIGEYIRPRAAPRPHLKIIARHATQRIGARPRQRNICRATRQQGGHGRGRLGHVNIHRACDDSSNLSIHIAQAQRNRFVRPFAANIPGGRCSNPRTSGNPCAPGRRIVAERSCIQHRRRRAANELCVNDRAVEPARGQGKGGGEGVGGVQRSEFRTAEIVCSAGATSEQHLAVGQQRGDMETASNSHAPGAAPGTLGRVVQFSTCKVAGCTRCTIIPSSCDQHFAVG